MDLPPLNALRAFEAAARTGSYVSAAHELGVTPAAVSQQVQKLERHYGRLLFDRLNNRILLTEAGREIHAGAAEGLSRIAEMTAHALTGASRLVISTPPSLVERWLAPLLPRFREARPDVNIEVRVQDDPLDLAAEGLDIRVCYGARLYHDHEVTPLFEDQVAPLASPDFIRRHGLVPGDDFHGIDGRHLILTNWGPSFATHPTWDDWAQREDAERRPFPVPALTAGSSGLALELARQGLGVALGQLALARRELASGTLVRLSGESLPIGHPYCAVTHAGHRRRPSLIAMIDALQAEAPAV